MKRAIQFLAVYLISSAGIHAASVIGFVTPSNTNACGFSAQVDSSVVKNGTLKFRVMLKEMDAPFCTRPETHLSTVKITENSQSVTQVRKINSEKKEGTIVSVFSVKSKELEDSEFCFVFTNFSEVLVGGKIIAMPSASFVCVRLKDFMKLAVTKGTIPKQIQ